MKKLIYLLIMVVALTSINMVPCQAATPPKGYGGRAYCATLKKDYYNTKYKLRYNVHYYLDKKTKKISVKDKDQIDVWSYTEYNNGYEFEITPISKFLTKGKANKKYIEVCVQFMVTVKRNGRHNRTFYCNHYAKIKVNKWNKNNVSLSQTSSSKK